MARFEKELAHALAWGVMNHIALHSKYNSPTPESAVNYLFILPQERCLTYNDVLIKNSRFLSSWLETLIFKRVYVSGVISRPRKLDQTAPWFEGFTERQHRNAYQRIFNAVQNAPSMSDEHKEAQANNDKEFFKKHEKLFGLTH